MEQPSSKYSSESNSGGSNDEYEKSSNMERRNLWVYMYLWVKTTKDRVRNRSAMFNTTSIRVGDAEGRIGRKTVELNQNQTPDRG